MSIDGALLILALITTGLTVGHSIQTIIATRKRFYDDYVKRKRSR